MCRPGSLARCSTFLIALLGGLAGCATVQPAAMPTVQPAATPIVPTEADGYAYRTGKATQNFPAPPTAVLGVLSEAMADLEMTGIHRAQDGTAIQLAGKTGDRRTVRVTLRALQGITQVGVRIGWFGDEPLSRALMNRIGVRLGTRPPEAIPAVPPSSPSPNPYFSRSAIPDEIMLRDFADAPFRDRVIP